MPEDNPDWFANIENIKPIRGGRAASSLNSLARSSTKVSAREAEDKFRAEFDKAQTSEDPLALMHGYLHWFQRSFPSGKPSLLYPILYKICTTYGNDERYQHDERLLKMWMELAESFPERGLAVMDFAFTRGSLREMAKFYVRWSEMYDNMKNATRARDTLELGISNRAMPLNILHEAKDRLEARLLRDMVIQTNEDSDLEEIDMDHSEDDDYEYFSTRERLPIGRLRGLGDAGEAPMIRRALATPVGRVGRIHGLPQSTPQASFKIFEDKAPMKTPKPTPSTSKGNRLVDEFADDPDYKALFGFFDHRPKTTLHLHTDENDRRPTKQWTQCGVKELCEVPAAEPEFEIYTDEPLSTPQLPKVKPKASAALQKAKMKLRKEFALEMSIEEGYAMLIETKKVHGMGDCA